MTRLLSLLFILIVIVFGLYFGLLNAEPVTLNYYFGTQALPLSLVMMVALLIGALLGAFARTPRIIKLKLALTRARRELGHLKFLSSKYKS